MNNAFGTQINIKSSLKEYIEIFLSSNFFNCYSFTKNFIFALAEKDCNTDAKQYGY